MGLTSADFRSDRPARRSRRHSPASLRQPIEDLRLISTPGFSNLPDESPAYLRVPLLFLYRGEVVPSFTLQAILLWLRVTLGRSEG